MRTPIEDEAAVAYRVHHGRVYRYLLGRTRDHHLAEELTQQVFADAVAALARSDTRPHALVGWLYRVAERRFVDEIRRTRRYEELADDSPDVRTEIYPGYGRAVADALRRGIAQLPADQRTVVIQHLLEDRSHVEIASDLAITEDASKMRFSRAMRQLRAFLSEHGV